MDTEINTLKRILLHDIPILFTGAGFNYGAKTKKGILIPNGSELKRIIIEDYLKYGPHNEEHRQLSSHSLKDVSLYAQTETNKNRFTDFLTDYFSDIIPAEYHYKLTCYPWRRIYTTNIDDLIESVYKTNRKDYVRQNMKRQSTIKNTTSMNYLKLHGCVNNPSEGYIFSADEYIDSIIQTEDYRFANLKIDMHNESIIFIGSDFNDFNIDYYLKLYENSGNISSRGKLVFINPTPSVIFMSKVKKHNGIIIKWTTEQFLNFLCETYTFNQDKEHTRMIHASKAGFLQLYSYKKKIKKTTRNYYSKLYEGHHPKWEDIFTDWDIPENSVRNAFNSFIEKVYTNKYGIFSLYGKAFTGKSTLIKRISNDLLDKGYEVIFFQGKELNIKIYAQFVGEIIKNRKGVTQIALVVDNATYSYFTIREIIKKTHPGINTIVITASRTIQHRRYRYVLIDNNFHEFEIPNYIDTNFATNIIEKLREKGFLGVLKQFKTVTEQVSYLRKQNDILSILFEITNGKGFINRFQNELMHFLKTKSIEQDLLLNLVIFEQLGLPFFPKELISDFYKEKSQKVISRIQNFIKYNNQGDYALRTNFFNRQILSRASEEQLITQIKEILIFISPLVNVDTHNYWNEIHASLSRPKSLRELGVRPENTLEMLYSIRNYYYENFHYWIQLGIAESNSGEFDKATNHFTQAENLFSESYLLKSAMGTNYLKKAVKATNSIEAEPYFKKGENILTTLIDKTIEFEITSYTTHSYVCQKINYLKKFEIDASQSDLRKLIKYSELLLEKDPNDTFTKDTRKRLYEYLKFTQKTNLMKIELNEIKELTHSKPVLTNNDTVDDLDII